MLNREDVIRITEEVLKGLRLDVDRGHWTSPNERMIVLKYKDVVIDRMTFDVVQTDEYEG